MLATDIVNDSLRHIIDSAWQRGLPDGALGAFMSYFDALLATPAPSAMCNTLPSNASIIDHLSTSGARPGSSSPALSDPSSGLMSMLPRTGSALSVQSEVSQSPSVALQNEFCHTEDVEFAVINALRLVHSQHIYDINATLTESKLNELRATEHETHSTLPLLSDDTPQDIARSDRFEAGMSVLTCCIALGFSQVCDFVLKELGASAFTASPLSGELPIHVACRFGRSNILRTLLLPCTPLWMLQERTQPHMYSGGAEDFLTPMGVALKYRSFSCIHALLDRLTGFENAATKARELLCSACDPSPNELGQAAQSQVADCPYSSFLTNRVDNRANILHFLCRNSHDHMYLALLERLVYQGPCGVDKAMVQAKDHYGRTPHFYATTSQALRCLSLVSKDIPVSPSSSFSLGASFKDISEVPVDKYQNTPLHCLAPSTASCSDLASPFLLSGVTRSVKESLLRRILSESNREDDAVACLTSLYVNNQGLPVFHALLSDTETVVLLIGMLAKSYFPMWKLLLKLCQVRDSTPRGNTALHTCAERGYHEAFLALFKNSVIPLNTTPDAFIVRAKEIASLLTIKNNDGLPPLFLAAHCPGNLASHTAAVLLQPALEILKAVRSFGDQGLLTAVSRELLPVVNLTGEILTETHIIHYFCQSNATEAFRGWRKAIRAIVKNETINGGPSPGVIQKSLISMYLSKDQSMKSNPLLICIQNGNVFLLAFLIRSILATTDCHTLLQVLSGCNDKGELSSFFSTSQGLDGSSPSKKAPRYFFQTPPPNEAQLEIILSVSPPPDALPALTDIMNYAIPTWARVCGSDRFEDGSVTPSNSLFSQSAGRPHQNKANELYEGQQSNFHRKSLMLLLIEKFFLFAAGRISFHQQRCRIAADEGEDRRTILDEENVGRTLLREHHPERYPIIRRFPYSDLRLSSGAVQDDDINPSRRYEYLSSEEFFELFGCTLEQFAKYPLSKQQFFLKKMDLVP